MRAGNLRHRIRFYAKVTARDDYSASVDTWPTVTISTRGEVRHQGGSMTASNEERFFSKRMELTVRYRADITETMRVQIDEKDSFYMIDYIEEIGNREGLRLTLEKINL